MPPNDIKRSRKETIVLKIGSRTLEIGLSGHPKPLYQCSISQFSLLVKPPHQFEVNYEESTLFDQESKSQEELKVKAQLDDEFRYFKSNFFRDRLIFKNNHKKGDANKDEHEDQVNENDIVGDLDYNLSVFLNQVIRCLFFKQLKLNLPSFKILILENQFLGDFYKNLISNCFQRYFNARHVNFVSNSMMALFATGSPHALVIDLGWNFTTIEPIFDYRLLRNHIVFTKRGGFEIHKQYLCAMQNVQNFENVENKFDFVEDFIIKFGYVRPDIAEEAYGNGAIKFRKCQMIRKLQYEPIEAVLFPHQILNQNKDNDEDESGDDEFDSDEKPIIELTVKLIKSLPIDIRSTMVSNMIITGGISKIPGMKSRFIKELKQSLVECGLHKCSDEVRSLKTLGSWCGASLYSSTSLLRYQNDHRKKVSKGRVSPSSSHSRVSSEIKTATPDSQIPSLT
ncbi:unnamed protein product [Ambrosiozyma monospora]|uniref:Unnamed protein product n=1 Tax=Ambrosiozyma monospora TaxID=43982 RepID=A0A9W6Z0W7_AMBMO|nr:unnamed protein product [Ambrosiozyma monospora]